MSRHACALALVLLASDVPGAEQKAQPKVTIRPIAPLDLVQVEHPVVGAEARVRLGYLQWVAERDETAVQDLAAAAAQTSDPDIRYLAEFLRGWIAIQRGAAATRTTASAAAPRRPGPAGEQIIREAAERTGGQLHEQSRFFRASSIARAFKSIFDDFRQSYVLRYSPSGVKMPGWHAIVVAVPSAKAATIRARQGYYGTSLAP